MSANHEPLLIGSILGTLTSIPAANAQTLTDIFTGDATEATRVDFIGLSTDDPGLPSVILYLNNGAATPVVVDIGEVNPNRQNPYAVTGQTIAFDATAKTITRSAGSWLTDGYVVGDVPVITGAADAGNNTSTFAITALSATVMTLGNATGMVTRAAATGATFAKADPAFTALLSHANLSGRVATDSNGNKFLNLPPGWKLQAKFIGTMTTGKTAKFDVRAGKY